MHMFSKYFLQFWRQKFVQTPLNSYYSAGGLKKINPFCITSKYGPAGIYLLKVNNRNTRTMCEIWPGVFIVNFEHISRLALVFLLLLWTCNCRLDDLNFISGRIPVTQSWIELGVEIFTGEIQSVITCSKLFHTFF